MKILKAFSADRLKPKIEQETRQDPIENPLWDLMLFTNDCYPGCSCDRDFFDMTPAKVQLWLNMVGKEDREKAMGQVDRLINCSSLDLERLSSQTNFYFDNRGEAIAWLLEWKVLLTKASSSADRTSVKHTAQKKR
jgi:hypothetical protein